MDGRTYPNVLNVLNVRSNGHLRPALLGLLCRRVDLKDLKPGLVASLTSGLEWDYSGRMVKEGISKKIDEASKKWKGEK